MAIVRALNVIVALLFGASALLQFNDPDPVLWGVFYAVAASACLAWQFGYLPMLVSLAITLVCTLWIIALGPQLALVEHWDEVWASFAMSSDSVEAIREVTGLLFVGLWMLLLTLCRPDSPPKPPIP